MRLTPEGGLVEKMISPISSSILSDPMFLLFPIRSWKLPTTSSQRARTRVSRMEVEMHDSESRFGRGSARESCPSVTCSRTTTTPRPPSQPCLLSAVHRTWRPAATPRTTGNTSRSAHPVLSLTAKFHEIWVLSQVCDQKLGRIYQGTYEAKL